MRKFVGLLRRNLLLYFKDVQTIIFSLLTSIIVLILYLAFLKGTFVDAIESAASGLGGLISSGDIETLSNAILLSGVLGSATITVSYSCLGTVVHDRENRIDYDISATPIKRWQIILSYFASAVLSAFIMTSFISMVGLGILSCLGDLYIGFGEVAALLGVNLLGALSATSIFMLVVLCFKTSSASGAFFGILSAAAGFLMGAYVPLSQFSQATQSICGIFPLTGVTVLFRNLLMNNLLDKINSDIGGLDGGMFAQSVKEIFTFELNIFGNTVSISQTVLYVLAFTAICIAAMAVIYPKVYKRK